MSLFIKKDGVMVCLKDPMLCSTMSAGLAGKHRKFYPDSPYFKNLSPMMKATVEKALEDASLQYKCSKSDLVVAIEVPKRGMPKAPLVIHIKKKQSIEIR